jgi:glucosamine--fructose-6-phosphate aminotransferase (isomerizing)
LNQNGTLIEKLPRIIADQAATMEIVAGKSKDESIFYVIGSGPSYGIAYKLAMTQLTENAWVHGVVQYSTEFRHGIVEKIEPETPVIFLIGSDTSRIDLERELETCRKHEAKPIVWDAYSFPETDEFLEPFHLSAPANWFVYYLASLRKKLPLERRYIGLVIPYANVKSHDAKT